MCPCCELCSEILENIDAQLLSIEDSQRITKELSNHWVRDEVAASIAHAAEPLSQPLTLVSTVTKEFVEAVAAFRKVEQDSRLLRKVLNYVGWGSVSMFGGAGLSEVVGGCGAHFLFLFPGVQLFGVGLSVVSAVLPAGVGDLRIRGI